MLRLVPVLVLFALALPAVAGEGEAAPARAAAGAPQTKIAIVEETLHGQKIADPYRWLESTESAETQAYSRAQMEYTRSVLDPLPGREKIRARLAELLAIGTLGTPRVAGKFIFYTRRDTGQNQPVLYVREGVDGKDRALVDVNQMAADATVALDWWYPSEDGTRLAYGTSSSGSEISTLYVLETATGKLLPDTIVTGRAASVAWKPDNSGFYYSRYPWKGEVPAGEEAYHRKIFYHAMGGAVKQDPLVFGDKLGPQDWPGASLSEDGRWLLLPVFQGWTKSELHLQDLKSNEAPAPLATGKNFLYNATVHKGVVYILTNEDAPRYRVMQVAATNSGREHWKVLIPEDEAVLKDINIIGGKIFAEYEKNAASQLRVFSLEGKPLEEIALPTIGSVTGVGGQWDSKEAFFGFHSYSMPPTIFKVSVADGKVSEWARVEAPVDPTPYEVKQVWYASKDGTKVPMFLVHRKGVERNGKNPTLLYGYGGFQVSMTPAFRRSLYLWLEHGGVYAEANLRGGSEFGEEWHRGGMLGQKQNVFDDFIAAAEYLIAEKYTDKEHLAVQGGSNGGLLTGAVLTQRPDLFRAVVCQVPLLDMLRYQNFQIAKLWIPEYGSAEDAEQFQWLYAYSPYHNVKEGAEYPAVLFTTAESDTRVDPMHARKMAARLQATAKNGPEKPILLRIELKAGHGQGKPVSKQIEEGTDVWSFLFWQLGVK